MTTQDYVYKYCRNRILLYQIINQSLINMGCCISAPERACEQYVVKTEKRYINAEPLDLIEPNEPEVNNLRNVPDKPNQVAEKQIKICIQNQPSQHKIQGFGQVNEIAVNNARLFPVTKRQKLDTLMHRSIVAISGTKKNRCGVIVGGGVMLSKNIILTAAHNIIDQQKKQYEKNKYRIYLESDGLKYYQIQGWRYLNQYIIADPGQDIEFDYAIIKLKDNPNQPIFDSYPQLSLPCQCILNRDPSITLDIFGYPGLQSNFLPRDPKGITIHLCQYGLSKQDSIVEIKNQFIIKYSVSTLSGQSGCPIFVDNKVIAIHKGGILKQQCNFGRLLTKDMTNNIQQWCKELNGDPIKIKINNCCWHKKQLNNILQKLITNTLQSAFGQMMLLCQHFNEAAYLEQVALINVAEGNFIKAIELYQQSLKICQKINGVQSYQSHVSIQKIAVLYQKILNHPKSLQYYFRSLKIKETVKGKGCYESANTLHFIGWVYNNQGTYEKAQEYYNYALQIYEKTKGKGCYQSATTLNNLGVIYAGRFDPKAEKYYSQALDIQERAKGKGCFQSANTLNNMGIFHNKTNNFTIAMECYILALQIYERVFGKGCYESAGVLMNMGLASKNQGNYDQSLKYYTLAHQIKSKIKGKESQLAEILHNMGIIYDKKLNSDKAFLCYAQALKISQTTKGKGCIQSANIYHDMGVAYKNQMNYNKALECFSQSLQIKERIKGRQSFQSVVTLNQMGDMHYNQGDDFMALEYYSLSSSISARGKGNEASIGITLKKIGSIRLDQKDYENAVKAFQLAVTLFQMTNMKSEAKESAVKLATCFKNLNKLEKLSEIITKYGLETFKF